MARWHFRPLLPGVTVREPIQAEFFAAEAISDPGVALIREGIQNSLDAARAGEKVTVRVYLSGDENGPRADSVAPLFSGVWDHLKAKHNGLRADEVPSPETPCPFLAFEDFGTTGLEGDVAEPFQSRTGRENHFYHFFRAEGQSDKKSSDRGIWGVGKHVFFRSSRISGMFGLTVRSDDGGRMLMGKIALKSHWVDDAYCQDGYFGIAPENGQPLVMPVDERAFLDRFAELFDLQRGNDPGLSVVVPWPHQDITEESIVRAVLHGYFYPILTGRLEVFVETPGVKAVLEDADSLIATTRKMDEELAARLLPLLELADWARQLPDDQKQELTMTDPGHAWQWSSDLFSDDLLEWLRKTLQSGEKAALRVPVTVRPKDGPPQASRFDVFMARDQQEQSGRPTFVREDIIVPEVDAPRTRGIRALVVADDLPLAAFLRAAENPAHTEWQHDGSNFRGMYRSGRRDLDFVKRSVREIAGILSESQKEEDPTLLVGFFSLPPLAGQESVRAHEKESDDKGGGEPPEPPKPPPPTPASLRVTRVAGGFSVRSTEEGVRPPVLLDIQVAYDVRRGSPLKRYDPSDFKMEETPIAFNPEPDGVEVVEAIGNRILARVTDATFSLHVKGFDERRDLYVRATARKEAEDGD